MSDYIKQYESFCHFSSHESWTILSPIELSIKRKIEAIGTPLKDWDIKINRGILTGCNEAFIINSAKRDELIAFDPKSAKIIRPVLRGRNIKRYNAQWGGLWLINTHNGTTTEGPVKIDYYPAIKKHLDQYYPQLEARCDQGITPYNLRSCAYTDTFLLQCKCEYFPDRRIFLTIKC